MSRIVLFGATSEIGGEIITRLASGNDLVLAARRPEALTELEDACRTAGASAVESVFFDAGDVEAQASVIDDIESRGAVDTAIAAFGVLGDNEVQWQNQKQAVLAAQVNYTGAVSVGVLLADRMKKQGHGQIVVFSSVAGEMVRRSNFVYGSTKAGVDGFYRMLGEALRGTGVRVLTVRPGQVRTNMTAGLDDAPLTVDKEDAAKAIAAGVDGKKTVIWIHPLFRWVMLILKNLPQFVVRKLPI